jgi:hypothetical protein
MPQALINHLLYRVQTIPYPGSRVNGGGREPFRISFLWQVWTRNHGHPALAALVRSLAFSKPEHHSFVLPQCLPNVGDGDLPWRVRRSCPRKHHPCPARQLRRGPCHRRRPHLLVLYRRMGRATLGLSAQFRRAGDGGTARTGERVYDWCAYRHARVRLAAPRGFRGVGVVQDGRPGRVDAYNKRC